LDGVKRLISDFRQIISVEDSVGTVVLQTGDNSKILHTQGEYERINLIAIAERPFLIGHFGDGDGEWQRTIKLYGPCNGLKHEVQVSKLMDKYLREIHGPTGQRVLSHAGLDFVKN